MYLVIKKQKSLVSEGIIGELECLETSFCGKVDYNQNSYLFDIKQGGCLLDLGIYNIAYLDDYFKVPLDTVDVTCKYHDCGVDTYVKAIFKFLGNKLVLLNVRWIEIKKTRQY